MCMSVSAVGVRVWRRRWLLALQMIAVTVLFAVPAQAVDRKVPSQYATIQAGINAAQPFDRVVVAPGTYREHIVVPARPIVLVSEQGAEKTTIDGGGSGGNRGSVVTIDANATNLVMVQGFTIRGGYVEGDFAYGAGIHCPGGTPIIIDNVVRDCKTYGYKRSHGAGLYLTGRATVVNNVFRDNIAIGFKRGANFAGAGIYATAGVFLGNEVIDNQLVSANSINDRLRDARGAGAYLAGSTWFLGNRVLGNYGAHFSEIAWGGGLYLTGSPLVALNQIRNNSANANRAYGGGIACAPGSTPTIENNVIADNVAQGAVGRTDGGQGGGIYVDSGSRPVIAYNTIVYNRVSANPGIGGGIKSNGGAPTITGCILWDNTYWKNGADQRVTSFHGVAASAVNYCLIGDGQFTGMNDNFRDRPLLNGLYHLSNGSPCIDAGELSPTLVMTTDVDNAPRFLDGTGRGDTGRIDIGASEYHVLRRTERKAVRPGDVVPLELDTRQWGHAYYLAASLGTAGIPLPPPDPRTIGLSPDILFFISLGQRNAPFENFGGVLDGDGRADAKLSIANDPRLAGVSIHVAGMAVRGTTISLVTNSVAIEIQ